MLIERSLLSFFLELPTGDLLCDRLGVLVADLLLLVEVLLFDFNALSRPLFLLELLYDLSDVYECEDDFLILFDLLGDRLRELELEWEEYFLGREWIDLLLDLLDSL